MRTQEWWDRWFLGLAQYVSTASKDPSTKTGAVLVDNRRRVVGLGYNGFPPGIADTPERLNDRTVKYALTVHCERNAVVNSNKPVVGATLYVWPFFSCTPCAVLMIAAGIQRIVAPVTPPDKVARWGEDLDRAAALCEEAGVQVTIVT